MNPVRRADLARAHGSALMWVLVVVAVISILAAGVARSNVFGLRSAAFWEDRLQAFYAAESGLNIALYRIQQQGESPPAPGATSCTDAPWFQSGPDDFPDAPDTGYRVCLEEVPDGRVLVAQGYSGRSTRTVRLTIRKPRSAAVYFRKDLQQSGIIEVGGTRNWQWPEVTLPDLSPPPGTPAGPEPSGNPPAIPPGTYRYKELTVNKEETLRIAGPATIYVERNVTVENEATLEIAGAPPVFFFVNGDFTLEKDGKLLRTVDTSFYVGDRVAWKNDSRVEGPSPLLIVIGDTLTVDRNAEINAGADASSMGIYLVTTPAKSVRSVDIKNDVTFTGGLYAPTLAVKIENGSRVTGAVVGETVDVKKNAATDWSDGVQDAPSPHAGEVGGGAWTADWGTWSEE